MVTGASGGIGRTISLAFAEAGWFIGVHYYQNKKAAEITLKQVVTAGGEGALYQADVRSSVEVAQMVQSFCREEVIASAMICSAGIAGSSLVLRQREEDWNHVMTTNLSGVFHCLRAIGPVFLARGGGSILIIGSHAGFHGTMGQAAYAASKAGLIGLIKSAALEWGDHNVRINLVLPGWQQTGMSKGAIPDEIGYPDHALRRPPVLTEVARTVLYLAQTQDVSGQVWNCDSRYL